MLIAHGRYVAVRFLIRSAPLAMLLALLLAFLLVGGPASAQDFNVKCGPGFAPSSAFGAASGQTGPWNSLQMEAGNLPLVDTAGRSTGAFASAEDCDGFACDDCDSGPCPGFSGSPDEAALLTSYFNGDCIADLNAEVHALIPGTYEMHIYAYNGCSPTLDTGIGLEVRDSAGSTVYQSLFQIDGAPFEGSWAAFPIGIRTFAVAPGEYVRVRWGQHYGGGLCGFQLHRLDGEAGAPFCPGDGSAVACPCANNGGTGRGCENSASTGGAALVASGQASLSLDTVTFTTAWEMPSALTVFFQGSTAVGPFLFGDGVRCVGGNLKRLYAKSASFGFSSAPGPSDPSVSGRSAALGDPIPNGGTRYYQAYYRDPNPQFCPLPQGSTFNASSGIVIVWGA